MNPYEVLGVQSGASIDEIRSAYHRLAKQWHPDRFKGQERIEAEERFRQLAEAFNMLKDSGRREEPVKPQASAPAQAAGSTAKPKDPSQASPVPPQNKTAQDWYMDADQAFQNGEFDRALGLVQYAIRQDGERAEFHALHAKALDKFGGNPRTMTKALETAVRLNPKDIDSTIRLAEIYQSLGMHTRATRLWETARNLNPKHPIFRKQAAQQGKEGTGPMKQVSFGSGQPLAEQWVDLKQKLKKMIGR